MACKDSTQLFNAEKHGLSLNAILLDSLRSAIQLSYKGEDVTSSFFTNLILNLSENTDFLVKYEAALFDTKLKRIAYDNSISLLIASIRTYITQLRDKDDDWKKLNMLTLADLIGIADDEHVNAYKMLLRFEIAPEALHHHGDINEVIYAEVEGGNFETNKTAFETKYKLYKLDIYGNNFGAEQNRHLMFTRTLFNSIIINLYNGDITITNLDLNKSLCSLLNDLYKKIVAYLKTISEFSNRSYASNMYDLYGNLQSGYVQALKDMATYLYEAKKGNASSFQSVRDTHKSLFNRIDDDFDTLIIEEEELEFLSAVNAYTNLKYFDLVLADSVGLYISISKNEKGVFHNASVGKYKFGHDSSHSIKGWNDKDAMRTSVQNTSKFSKVVLNYLPLLSNSVGTSSTIGISAFTNAFTFLFANINKLRDANKVVSNSARTDVNKLFNIILHFHQNPEYYAHELTKLIYESTNLLKILQNDLKLTTKLLDVIKSIYLTVFAFTKKDFSTASFQECANKSLSTVINRRRRVIFNVGKYNIVGDIAGLIDDCMQTVYTLSTYASNGMFEFKQRSPWKDRHFPEKFRARTNKSILAISKKKCDDFNESASIEFANSRALEDPTVTIHGFRFNGTQLDLVIKYKTDGRFGIMTQTSSSTVISNEISNNLLLNVLALFDNNSPIQLDSQQINRIVKGQNLNLDEHNFRMVLQFIDLRLGTLFLSYDGLHKFLIFKGMSDLGTDTNVVPYIKDLILYAVKALVVGNIYREWKSPTKSNGGENTYKNKPLTLFLRNLYPVIYSAFTDDTKRGELFENTEGIYDLIVLPVNTNWVTTLGTASVYLLGEESSATSKNQSGTNDANWATSFLGLQYNYMYNRYRLELLQIDSELDENFKKAFASLKLTNPTLSDEQITSILFEQGIYPSYKLATTRLLFTNNQKAIVLTVINSDIKNREKTVKAIKELKSSELFYNAIIHNFWSSYINDKTFVIQPTTYSDKTKFILYLINASYNFKGNKSLSNMSTKELVELYYETIGRAHKAQLILVLKDLGKLLDINVKIYDEDPNLNDVLNYYVQIINTKLRTLTKEDLLSKALEAKMDLEEETHYRTTTINGENRVTLNESIVYLALDVFGSKESTARELLNQRTEFINNLVLAGTFFYIGYSDSDSKIRRIENTVLEKEIKQQLLISWIRSGSETLSPVARILNGYFKGETNMVLGQYLDKWTSGGKLVLAKTKSGKNIVNLEVTADDPIVEVNPLLEKFFYVESLVSNNIRLSLTGSENAHPDKFYPDIKAELTNVGVINAEDLLNKIKNKDIASLRAENYGLTESGLLALISSGGKLDIYALKTSNDPKLLQLANNVTRKIVATALGTLLKRNVIIPATLHYFHQGTLEGIDSELKVAFMEDIKAAVFNFSGADGSVDSMDGSTYVCAPQTILLNKSLFSLEVGLDLKTIGHFFSAGTMSAGLMKHAAFDINNERMRASFGSKVNLDVLYRKMLDVSWYDYEKGEWATTVDGVPLAINLTTKFNNASSARFDENGDPITGNSIGIRHKVDFVNEILEGQRLFYLVVDGEENYWEIDDFGYEPNSDPNLPGYYYTEEHDVGFDGDEDYNKEETTYTRVYHFFDSNGVHRTIKKSLGEKLSPEDKQFIELNLLHSINSLHNLWTVLGGKYSMSLNAEGLLKLSEASNIALTNFMNVNAYKRNGGNTYDFTRNSYDLPLKRMMISYITNKSAMKVGVKNINSVNAWTDPTVKLRYATLSSDGLGVQMNADHEIEEAELTEFSLVITALEAGGLLHDISKLVYMDLGKVANQASKLELDAIAKYISAISSKNASVLLKNQLLDVIKKANNANIEDIRKLVRDIMASLPNSYFKTRLLNALKELYYSIKGFKEALSKVISTSNQEELDKVKSEIYDIVARSIINNATSNEKSDLSADILERIARKFNLNSNHFRDLFKLPFSDPNVYNLILSSFVSLINKKSIKRKYPGSGCVMVPGYNIMQYYKFALPGLTTRYLYMSDDILRMARKARNEAPDITDPTDPALLAMLALHLAMAALDFTGIDDNDVKANLLILTYINTLQELQEVLTTNESFIPTDVVDVLIDSGPVTLNLTDKQSYYNFKDGNWIYFDKDANKIKMAYKNLLMSEPLLQNLSLLLALSNDITRLIVIRNIKEAATSKYMLLYYKPKSYRMNITTKRDLAPVRVSWTYIGEDGLEHTTNIFDLPQIKLFMQAKQVNRNLTLQVFQLLYLANKGEIDVTDMSIPIQIRNMVKGSVVNENAELIVSNMFALKYNTNDMSLAEIREKGVQAFEVKRIPKISSSTYDIVFSKLNGSNTYITFVDKSNSENAMCEVDNWEPAQLKTIERKGALDVWYISKDGRPLFKVGRNIVRNDLFYRDGVFYKKSKDNVHNTLTTEESKNLRIGDHDQVLEYVEFVTRYNNVEYVRDGNGNLMTKSLLSYYINKRNILKAFGLSYSDPNPKQVVLFNTFLTNLLDDIYASELHCGIDVNTTISVSAAYTLLCALKNMKQVDPEVLELVINPLNKCIAKENAALKERLELVKKRDAAINSLYETNNANDETYTLEKATEEYDSLEDAIKISEEDAKYEINLSKYAAEINKLLQSYYTALAQLRYASWEKSLDFVAARIPAQTLQSFMAMTAVAYTGSDKNICYVSHWQTWLLGSDYDIDKAYLMGFEIGNDGKLIKYSDLFDYTSGKTLSASLHLPTPINNILYLRYNPNLSAQNTFSILKYINNYAMAESLEEKIEIIAEALIAIHSNFDIMDSPNKHTKYYLECEDSDIAKEFINKLNKHEHTKISPLLEQLAYKVAVTGNIINIIRDLRNIEHAYLPITMKDLSSLADLSEKGEMVANMSLMNPLTKYIMLVLNMVGKKVIGITAVGEKVYFNLSYYYNEGIRSNNRKWVDNLKFSTLLSRIEGRFNNSPVEREITCLTDVNFLNGEQIKLFSESLSALQLLRKSPKYRHLTAEEILKVLEGRTELMNPEIVQLVLEFLQNVEYLKDNISQENEFSPSRSYADLLISQLLSAATDNAKELILDKINCGENLAKCYLHLIMLGFDIKDIVTFMTSPYVNLVSKLTEANMMDSYVTSVNVDDAVQMTKFLLPVLNFITGKAVVELSEFDPNEAEDSGPGVSTKAEQVGYKLKSILESYGVIFESDKINLALAVLAYINYKLENPSIKSIAELYKLEDALVLRMSDYVDYIFNIISSAISKYGNENFNDNLVEYLKDLEEFEKILDLANETSSLGGVLLGMNLGLATDKEGLISKINSISNLTTRRERKFGIFDGTVLGYNDLENGTLIKKSIRNYEKIVGNLVENATWLDYDLITLTFDLAVAFGIVGNFDTRAFLLNEPLTEEDVVYGHVGGHEIIIPEGLTYRQVATDYYNLIKGTWNILDVVLRVPHFKSILELLKTVYIADEAISAKSKIINLILKEKLKKRQYLDEKGIKAVNKYINDLLINRFFANYSSAIESLLTFPIVKGSAYMDLWFNTRIASNSGTIDLTTEHGRYAFKMLMEDEVIPTLRETGRYGDIVVEDYLNNLFLLNLTTEYDNDKKSFLSLDIDLLHYSETLTSSRKFSLYAEGLSLLGKILVGSHTLADFIILYNIITNLNLVGSDRLTSLLKKFIRFNYHSVITEYFKDLGEFDYSAYIDMKSLLELGYDERDLDIRLAPYYSEYTEWLAKEPIIKVVDSSGRILYKERSSKGSYLKISIFPRADGAIKTSTEHITNDLRANYLRHCTMPMKFATQKVTLIAGLKSSNIENVLRSIGLYQKDGVIKLFKDCI